MSILSQSKHLDSEDIKDLILIIDLAFDQVTIADNKGFITKVYKPPEITFGIHDMVGMNVRDLEKAGVLSKSITLTVLNSKKQETFIQDIQNGKRIMATAIPIFDENKNLKKVITFSRDITLCHDLEKRLRESEEMISWYQKEIVRIRNVELCDLIWRSDIMKKVIEITYQVAYTDATVTIYGESGVGKSLLAKFLHKISNRSDNPFITINCGAIPENLIESELFGYEKGAFTGAIKEGKPGYFEFANTGTVFLDEIGDMPLQLQVKLLHVIQDREVYRIGGLKPTKLDIRIITASKKNLRDEVSKGSFREDLFYRLNVIPITIPPLRQRKEDIPVMVEKFLDKYGIRYHKRKTLSPFIMDMVMKHDWPGNVRELENYIERLVIICNSDVISENDLPKTFLEEICRNEFSIPVLPNETMSFKRIKESAEKQLIIEASKNMKSTRQLAQLLGVNQSTIVRKLKKYKIDIDSLKKPVQHE